MTDPTPEPPARTAIPIPRFRQPRPPDPALATVPGDVPSSSPQENPQLAGRPPTSPQEGRPSASPLPSLEQPAGDRTRTSATKKQVNPADAKSAAAVIGGLLMIGLTSLGVWMARNGRQLRLPTVKQRDDIADPLGRIASRYLPTDLVTGTLADITEAAAATHAYALHESGPLITRAASANVFETQE